MEVYRKNDVDVTFSDKFMELAQLESFKAVSLEEVKKAREEIMKQGVNLQDGSEEWRSYVNETVLDCVEIMNKLIASAYIIGGKK